MNKKVSIIVPTKNSERTIASCLASIKYQSYKNIEIIVVDNNSSDKTKEIAQKYTKLVFNKGPERSAQRNFGARKSNGEYLLFIDSDMELSKDVIKECVDLAEKKQSLKKTENLGGIIIPEKSFGSNFWAKCKELERSFYWGVDWIEAPRFFNTEVFNIVGGYDEDLISGEDWDLKQKVYQKFTIGRIRSFILHDEGELKIIDDISKKFYYSKNIKKYKNKNKSEFTVQANLIKRYMLFFQQPKKLFKNPVLGFGVLFMKTAEYFVGGLGYILK